MRALRFTLLGVGLLATGIALAAPPAYLLRYKFHPGQVDRYTIQFTMRALPRGSGAQGGGVPPNPGSATSTLKVLRVNRDGSAQVAFSFGGMQTAAAGQTTSPPETVTYTLSPDGHVSDFRARRGSAVTAPGGGLVDTSALARMSAVLPPRPAKPGDRWSTMMPSPIRGGKPVRVSSRFVSVGKVGGQTTGKLKQFVTFPLNISVGQQGSGAPSSISGSLALTTTTDFGIEAGKPLAGSVDGGGVLTIRPAKGAQNANPMALDLQVHADIRLVR